MLAAAIDIIENNCSHINVNPKCEPQLGRRGLYTAIGGDKDAPAKSMAMLWVLNLSDGKHKLLDIAEQAGIPFAMIREAAELLSENGLLSRANFRP
jgi:aminopeptidase-like protein